MKIKKLLAALLVTLSTLFLTGCWSSHEINTLAISVCLGIDKTEDGYLITEQVINTKAIASKRAINETPVILYTAKGKGILESIRRISIECPRTIYVAHTRMIVLGESIAREQGIKEIIDFLARDPEYRTDFFFVIAKGTTAYQVLNTLTPLESIPGIATYNSLKISEKTWAPTKSIRIIELTNSILAEGKNPVMTGIEFSSGANTSDSTDMLTATDQIKKLQYTSLGAFKKDKLIGWLNEEESKGYNYIMGNVKNSVGSAFYGDAVKITGEAADAKSTIKASIENNKPSIAVEINVTQNIRTVEGDLDVSKPENKAILNEIAEKKIKSMCEMTVQKVQNELKSDIFGFGEVIHRKYPRFWEEIKNDWDDEFPTLPVNITVKVKTNQLGQITKPFFIKEEK